MGAVPFQEAKWPRSAKRAMSPTSPRRRAALDGPMPLRSCRLLPAEATSSVSWAFAALIFLSIAASSLISSEASWRRVRPAMSRGPHGCHQGAGLLGGQELLRAPGQ